MMTQLEFFNSLWLTFVTLDVNQLLRVAMLAWLDTIAAIISYRYYIMLAAHDVDQ